MAVWRRNEQTPLTNQHGQSPQPSMAEEKRGNTQKVFILFNKILLIIAIPNPNFNQNLLWFGKMDRRCIGNIAESFWRSLLLTRTENRGSSEICKRLDGLQLASKLNRFFFLEKKNLLNGFRKEVLSGNWTSFGLYWAAWAPDPVKGLEKR